MMPQPTPPSQPHLLDPATAGALWRASRLEAFRDRARGAGLLPTSSGDGREKTLDEKTAAAASTNELALLLARATQLSSELDALGLQQASGESASPWWADGEYDDAAADAANDRGVEALRRSKGEERSKKSKSNASSCSPSLVFAEQALAFVTEAVRLRPSSAVYCANRARAALACGNRETALEAAEEAAGADPLCSKAWLLRGKALTSLGRFSEAAESFARALELEGKEREGKTAATAKRLLGDARAAEAAARGAAAAGAGSGRSALRRDAASLLDRQHAGDALEAAERALRAQPGRHELLRARAEALILSGRLREAAEAAGNLLPGPDRDYLLAEAEWRSGEVEEAARRLGGGGEGLRRHAAAADLSSFLRERLLPPIEKGDVDSALAALPSRHVAPGLAARLLVERGKGRKEAERLALAESDALEALGHVPSHRGALRLLAEVATVSEGSEAADRAFLAFRKLHLASSGVEEEVEAEVVAAAARARREAEENKRNGGSSHPPRRHHYSPPRPPPPPRAGFKNRDLETEEEGEIAAALEELRIPRCPKNNLPSAAAVRAAFLSRAARCHPDKRGSSENDSSDASGEEFVRAHRAYRLLMRVASDVS